MIYSKKYPFAAAAALLMTLCGCTDKIEYPEGVDTLPTYSATGTVFTVYDTSERTLPPLPETTTTESTTTVIFGLTQTDESTADTSVSDTQSETSVCETKPPETESSLSLEDITEVGISEYYKKTQTTPATTTTFIPVTITESVTQSSVSITRPPVVTEPPVTSSSPQSGDGSEGVVTVAGAITANSTESVTTAASQTPALPDISIELTDGRISPYTGRKIISHPYSYYTLDDAHKHIYDKLTDAMLKCEDSVYFTISEKCTFTDLYDTYQLIFNDENRLFYISPTLEYITDSSTGYILRMKVTYNFSPDKIRSMKEEIKTSAEEILSKITPEMNDYDIVKLFHDHIITTCTYDENSVNPNNIYGALVDKKALCQAYSQSFTYLCSLAGIDSFIVLGVANEPHMWNVVKMDGEYYHVDLTWDDPDRAKNPDSVRYDYFGLTDERIRQLRQFDDYDYEIPAANGTKYQYYYYNNLVADSVEEARAIIADRVLKAAETKSSTVQIMCTSDEVFNNVVSVLFGTSADNIISVLDSVKDKAANRYNTESIYHNSNSNTRTVKIFLDYLD